MGAAIGPCQVMITVPTRVLEKPTLSSPRGRSSALAGTPWEASTRAKARAARIVRSMDAGPLPVVVGVWRGHVLRARILGLHQSRLSTSQIVRARFGPGVTDVSHSGRMGAVSG